MQNVLKRENMYLENMYLEGFQVILHFSPQNHTAKKRTGGGGGQKVLFCLTPSLRYVSNYFFSITYPLGKLQKKSSSLNGPAYPPPSPLKLRGR